MAKRKSLSGSDIRAEILSAARLLFIENGLANTSLKDIARVCGISTGTLSYYYASKSDLIFDVTDAHFNLLTNQLLEWVSKSDQSTNPQFILQVVFDTIVGDQMRGKLHHYLIEAAASSEPSIRSRFQHKYIEWREMIAQGLTHFQLDDQQNKIMSQLILAALDGLVIQAILGVEDINVREMTKYLASSFQNNTNPTMEVNQNGCN